MNTSLTILGHALNQPKSWLLAHSKYELNPDEQNTLQIATTQRLQGVPLPYILGQWDFYGRSFKVTPDVLIPRPETELLVDMAIHHTRHLDSPLIIDVGTGSGAIAVSLAAEIPTARIIALDLSWSALQIAWHNALQLDQPHINFVQSNLLAPFQTKFDLICANLPYIPTGTLETLDVANWEPYLALDGGARGVDAIQILLQQSVQQLAPHGIILLEIEATLGQTVLALAHQAFPNAKIELIRDLAGLDRIVLIQQP